ncbi:integrin alpha-E [Ochotona princeps]|uniref:integrin alpha-E n=1 Tax=Ochotona princeps TaxID=9978 RepID=UPI002714FB7D|nr:integrin alpha-E [Ochotona princeps]
MWLLLSLLCTAGLAPLAAFNVDVSWAWLTPKGAPFVLSVLLHQDPNTKQTWLLVTSPKTNRTSWPLHQCSLIYNEIQCHPVEHISMPKGRPQQVTVVRNHHGVLICIQVQSRKSQSLSSELTGNCSLLTPTLHPRSQAYFHNLENHLDPEAHVDDGYCHPNEEGSVWKNGSPARHRRALRQAQEEEEEEEEEAGTEIAIVLDGSGSIDPPDFQRAKDFISNMMRSFSKCFECNFALVQYGFVIQTEFDLRDSQDIIASLARVQNITQVKNVTKTASAIQHVLDNIFTPSHGSRKKASKVIVVLTDGETFEDPLNLNDVINSPQMQGIERFAIGVGTAFDKAKTELELKLIASEPDETHAFKVTNYSALDGLLSRLQQSIIHTEGAAGEALHFQLAQIGFSAQILDEEQVLLGAVGAFNWSGGALIYNMRSRQGRFLNQTTVDPEDAQYSYLGYSMAVLHKACGRIYLSGAPRHRQRGAVFELRKDAFTQALKGEQMGSYFGSELCPVDINMDGTTDLLLVAAPFYHVRTEEGRVYVYRLGEQDGSFSLTHTLSGYPGPTDARFGFAMAAVGDLNQDELTDVAIGAPLEGIGTDRTASFGSVYIYNGQWDGLSASPSQCIKASTIAQQLHYFGMSVAGGLDFNSDGLVDVTVGTLGQAVVLRSRPVTRLNASMTFTPSALPIGFNGSVRVDLCFESSAKQSLGGMTLNFLLDVDMLQPRKRLQCSGMRACSGNIEWNAGSSPCKTLMLAPANKQLCEDDCFSNITVNVSYHLQTHWRRGSQLHPILDHYTEPFAIFQLPYEKDCKNKLFCVAELGVASTISEQELVVGLTRELTMNISLSNTGEDSFMTSMTLSYPRNLHFKRMQKPPSPDIQCDDPKPVASVLILKCRVGHPILRRSSTNISVTWQLEENAFPNRTADITVTLSNSNEQRSSARSSHTLQFKHAFVAVLPKPSVTYVNTSRGLSEHKDFLFNIHGENPFGAEYQLQICVPVTLQGLQIVTLKTLNKTQVSASKLKLQHDEELVFLKEVRPVVGRAFRGVVAVPGSEQQGRVGALHAVHRVEPDEAFGAVARLGGQEAQFLRDDDFRQDFLKGFLVGPIDQVGAFDGNDLQGHRRVVIPENLKDFPKHAFPDLLTTFQLARGEAVAEGDGAFLVALPVDLLGIVGLFVLHTSDASATIFFLWRPKEALILVQEQVFRRRDAVPWSPLTSRSESAAGLPESVRLNRADLRLARARRTILLSRPPGAASSGELETTAASPKREALVPSSSASWLSMLTSGLGKPGRRPGNAGSRSWSQGVLHFCGSRARSLRRLGSGSAGSSDATDDDRPVLRLTSLLLLLLKKRFQSSGGNHAAAARPGLPPHFPTRGCASPRSGDAFPGVGAWLGLRQTQLLSWEGRLDAPGVSHFRLSRNVCFSKHVQKWYSVSCAVSSARENVTVAAEIALEPAKQLVRDKDISELQLLGAITFNRSLYEGLNAENHRTQITVIFLREAAQPSLALIIGSSVGGLLLLLLIVVILFKCGFFKRKYQQLNLESMRKVQLRPESLLPEDG